MASLTFERQIVAVAGTFNAGDVIPSGTAFDIATLTVVDQDIDLGGIANDFLRLATGETDTTFYIDGVSIGDVTLTQLTFVYINGTSTGSGSVTFSYAGVTYFIPPAALDIRADTVFSQDITIGSDSTGLAVVYSAHGMAVEDALRFTGQGYMVDGSGSFADRAMDLTLTDTDTTTAVTVSEFEQQLVGPFPFGSANAGPEEGTVNVSYAGGLIADVAVLRWEGSSGSDRFMYLFDAAALAGAGITVDDIIGLGSFVAGSHGLTEWADFGFAQQPRDFIGTERVDDVVGSALGDSFLGNGGNDILVGLAGDDTFDGGDGDDLIEGGAGNDIIEGGAGIDTVSYLNAAGGVSVYLQFTGIDVGGGEGVDTLTGIENLSGTVSADRLIGDANDNVLTGGPGSDILKGKGGTDTFFGNSGADVIWGDVGIDTIDGGSGADILYGLNGDDVLNGGTGGDFIYAGRDNDIVQGNGGNDEIRGNLGNDTLSGDGGIDDVRGGGGNDTLSGGADVDYLYGENGNDILDGGAGDDSLTGGYGAGVLDGLTDTFVYALGGDGGGFDRIKDFEDGIDVIDLTAFGFAGFGDVTALASDTGTGLRIDFGGGNVLFVEDFFLASFDVSDVVLS